MNRITILRALRHHPAGRTIRELSTEVGLSRPTVKLILAELGALDLVAEGELQDPSKRGGRPSRRFALAESTGLVAAVGIGIESTDVALATAHGEVISRVQLAPLPGVLRRSQIATGIDSLFTLSGRARNLLAVTIAGVIGSVAPGQRVLPNPTIPELSGEGYFPALASDLNCEVLVKNDADLAALGEYAQLAPLGVRDMIGLHANVAMGSGLILGGLLYAGHSGMAGELGVVDTFGWHTSHELLLDAAQAHGITVSELFRAAGAGASWAEAAVREFVLRSGPGILALILTVNPECLVLGGDICHAESVARAALEDVVAPLGERAPALRLSSLGSDCIVFGAIGLAADELWRRLETRAIADPVEDRGAADVL